MQQPASGWYPNTGNVLTPKGLPVTRRKDAILDVGIDTLIESLPAAVK